MKSGSEKTFGDDSARATAEQIWEDIVEVESPAELYTNMRRMKFVAGVVVHLKAHAAEALKEYEQTTHPLDHTTEVSLDAARRGAIEARDEEWKAKLEEEFNLVRERIARALSLDALRVEVHRG